MLQFLTGQFLTGLVGAKDDPTMAEAAIAVSDSAPDGTDFLQVMTEGEAPPCSKPPHESFAQIVGEPGQDAQTPAPVLMDQVDTPVETADLLADIESLSPTAIDLPRSADTSVPTPRQSDPTLPDSAATPAWVRAQGAPDVALIDPAYHAPRGEFPVQGRHTPIAQPPAGRPVISAMVSSDTPETGPGPVFAPAMISSTAQAENQAPSASLATVTGPAVSPPPAPELVPQSGHLHPRLSDAAPARDPVLINSGTDTASPVRAPGEPASALTNLSGAPTPLADSMAPQSLRDPASSPVAGQTALAGVPAIPSPARPVARPPSTQPASGDTQSGHIPDRLIAADRASRDAASSALVPPRTGTAAPAPSEPVGQAPAAAPPATTLLTPSDSTGGRQAENPGLQGEAVPELRGSLALASAQRAPLQPTAPRANIPRHMAIQMAEAVRAGASRPIDLMLNPAELGRVTISLQSTEGSVLVHIAADRPETLDLMRRHLDDLTQEFQSVGYSDAQFSFSDENSAGERDANPDGDVVTSLPETPEATDLTETIQTSIPGITITDRVDIRI